MKNQKTVPTLYVAQASHNDWDWVATFPEFYNGSHTGFYPYNVTQSLDVVFKSTKNDGTTPGAITQEGFVYNICEIAFLVKYYGDNKELFSKLESQIIENLHIVGGGITSPSSLLAYGESAIRNYLLGNNWIRAYLPGYRDSDKGHPGYKTLRNIWLPDSFALDPNLPALIRALGLEGCGSSRMGGVNGAYGIVGANLDTPEGKYTAITNSPLDTLIKETGPTFQMKSADGSSTVLHFMLDGYQGINTLKATGGLAFDTSTIFFHKSPSPNNGASMPKGVDALWSAWKSQKASDPIGLSQQYLHISEDMMQPCVDIQQIITDFNKVHGDEVKAQYASFDDFISALPSQLPELSEFQTTPYMDGFYASCPDLKAGVFAATNTLVAAEAFVALAQENKLPIVEKLLEDIHHGWQNLAPSTHHAYVTGLSVKPVYLGEQRPYLFYPCKKDHNYGDKTPVVPYGKGALTLGQESLQSVMQAIADRLQIVPRPNTTTVTVFNPAGMSSERLVEFETKVPYYTSHFTSKLGNSVQVNKTESGTYRCLFFCQSRKFWISDCFLGKTAFNKPH